ncbi:MAG TPA: VCBS repeat-containing protein [Niabella sp.]
MRLFFTTTVLCGAILFTPGASPDRAQSTPAKAKKAITFRKHVLTNDFVSEGVAVADVNNDGRPDVLAGAFWWEAPAWTQHSLLPPKTFAVKSYSNSFLNYTLDVNQDGWVDYIIIDYPGKAAHWYENPKNAVGYWKEHLIYPAVGNESPGFADIDGDGRPDLLCNDPINKRNIWVRPPDKDDTAWTAYTISSDTLQSTHQFTHGLGCGDVNGDGRVDVLVHEGWWEAPENPRQPGWKFHKTAIGDDCAQMYVLDLNKDGNADIISSSAHNYGIWWFEQQKTAKEIRFIKHALFPRLFSESHNLYMADINGDGYPDLITGKRHYAHNGGDPGAEEPSVLYWIECIPGKAPRFTPHLIDSASGAGLHLVVTDINKDGRPDIITGNKNGVFIFEQLK